VPKLAIPLILAALAAPAAALDLTNATIVTPPELSAQEAKAITMLIEEVDKRSGIRWEIAASPVTIEIARTTGPREGYSVHSTAHGVTIAGNDARGVLFGIGRLLRELRIGRGSIQLPDGFAETSAPRYPLRGHQLGYRPKSNTYDAWSPSSSNTFAISRSSAATPSRSSRRVPTTPPTARTSRCRPCA